MFRIRVSLLTAFAAALAGLAGCSSSNVMFVTKTSFGIDVTTQPMAANIGYDRFEGYFGPRFDTGAVPPVAANFETNGELLGRAVRQVYATGEAARMATRAASAPASSPELSGKHKVMAFNTGTTIGLKLGFGVAATDTLTFGYKRSEASIIPVTNGVFPAVLATLENEHAAKDRESTEFKVQQYFATGDAAVALAQRDAVRGLFSRRFEELVQARGALTLASCVLAVPDADLPRVWDHAAKFKLIGGTGQPTADQLKGKAATAAREHYVAVVSVPDAGDATYASRLDQHSRFVCGLAGR
jgi:hypothetical protein